MRSTFNDHRVSTVKWAVMPRSYKVKSAFDDVHMGTAGQVIKLREHEMRWAESTANEMSLRAEVCALKDEHASAAGDAAAFKKRCDVLLTENTELGERYVIDEDQRVRGNPIITSC